MITMEIHFYSSELTECSSLRLIAPTGKKKKYPILWLLPPMGCDHTRWCAYTDMGSLADQKQIFLAMPDIKLSCGLNMVHGLRFNSMLVKELPEFLVSHFPVDLQRQMIAGAEEGAYAALYAATENPGNYKKVIALSGGSLIEEQDIIGDDSRFAYAFGTENLSLLKGSSYDINLKITEMLRKTELYIAYGMEDKYRKSAKELADLTGMLETVDVEKEKMGWNEWYRVLEKRIK